MMLLCSFRALNGHQLEGAKQPENENGEEMMTLEERATGNRG